MRRREREGNDGAIQATVLGRCRGGDRRRRDGRRARARGSDGDRLRGQDQRLFAKLPGTVSFKIVAPATRRTARLQVSSRSGERLFIGSAFKTFVLAEALRQADSPEVVQKITQQQLALDASVWSLDSATFNPPNLSGTVSERTALEAMILHSDNTGTDMSMKLVGADKVRAFIVSAGLTNTLIPESTRSFIGYLLGAPDYLTFTWTRWSRPPTTRSSTRRSTPRRRWPRRRMISSRTTSAPLQGEFFENDQTLNEYRAILSIGDVIWLLPFPLGGERVREGRQHRRPRVPRGVCGGRHHLRRRLGLLLLHHQLDAAAETDPATVVAWAAASSRALQLVKDSLAA